MRTSLLQAMLRRGANLGKRSAALAAASLLAVAVLSFLATGLRGDRVGPEGKGPVASRRDLYVASEEPFGLTTFPTEGAPESGTVFLAGAREMDQGAPDKPPRSQGELWAVSVDGVVVGTVSHPELVTEAVRRLASRAKTYRGARMASAWSVASARRDDEGSANANPRREGGLGVAGVRQADWLPAPRVASVTLENRICISPENARPEIPSLDGARLERALADLVRFDVAVEGYVIEIDGRPAAALADRASAEATIAEISRYYRAMAENALQGTVTSVQIKEDVTIRQQPTAIENILSKEEALTLLRRGTLEERPYQVKPGDSFWSIARSIGMRVEDLMAANPGKDPERLQPGETLSTVVPKPYLTVRTVEEASVTQEIPFATEVRKLDSLWPWERKVLRPGSPGKKVLTYEIVRENGREIARKTLSEVVLSEPISQVLAVGTRAVTQRGTGRYAWPVPGAVTSYFGPRGRDFHYGIDIAAPTGTPVGAADSGTVVYAGRLGGYGICVMVDHGGGIVTVYGHLSSASVKPGDEVSRGEPIGKVGRTGNATGPHLHFEIRQNGEAVNPLKFFK